MSDITFIPNDKDPKFSKERMEKAHRDFLEATKHLLSRKESQYLPFLNQKLGEYPELSRTSKDPRFQLMTAKADLEAATNYNPVEGRTFPSQRARRDAQRDYSAELNKRRARVLELEQVVEKLNEEDLARAKENCLKLGPGAPGIEEYAGPIMPATAGAGSSTPPVAADGACDALAEAVGTLTIDVTQE